jgi:hypothetical protein
VVVQDGQHASRYDQVAAAKAGLRNVPNQSGVIASKVQESIILNNTENLNLELLV